MASPCIKVCAMDASGAYCIGCFRTLDEIGAWPALANAERAAVLEKLPARRRQLARGTPARCANCGIEFPCGAGDATQPCWCAGYPAVMPSASATRCLCPACLAVAAGGPGATWASD
ncbi:MAG TPA: cysteine-rich CWC family protein [Usitatibacter sp.]|nr:cysteine-rich CWC family protein [Usitatibacter sp.]